MLYLFPWSLLPPGTKQLFPRGEQSGIREWFSLAFSFLFFRKRKRLQNSSVSREKQIQLQCHPFRNNKMPDLSFHPNFPCMLVPPPLPAEAVTLSVKS